jgi:hypothetical protein
MDNVTIDQLRDTIASSFKTQFEKFTAEIQKKIEDGQKVFDIAIPGCMAERIKSVYRLLAICQIQSCQYEEPEYFWVNMHFDMLSDEAVALIKSETKKIDISVRQCIQLRKAINFRLSTRQLPIPTTELQKHFEAEYPFLRCKVHGAYLHEEFYYAVCFSFKDSLDLGK